jgi:hypothetical protein
MGSALLALLLGFGIVHGRITYSGRAPAPRKLTIAKDPQVCGATRDEEIFRIGSGGGVMDVVVYLSGDKLGEPPEPATITLDQKNCRYVPHVQIAPVRSTLQVRTSDPVTHNVHSFLNGSTVINFAMPPSKSLVLSKTLDKPGGEQLKCDIHNFMTGGIFVTATKYAVLTGDDGAYEIRDVPEGTWMITTWHQSAGAITAQVKVTDGGTTEFNGKIR